MAHYCSRCLNAPVQASGALCPACVAYRAKAQADVAAAAAKPPRYGYRRGTKARP